MAKEKEFTPFSNGTDAQIWTSLNCEKCSRAWFPDPDKPVPGDKAIKEYVRIGKYCKLQYYVDLGYVTGTIPDNIADEIGKGTVGLVSPCDKFTDDPAVRFKYPSAVPPRVEKMKPIKVNGRNYTKVKKIVREILEEIPATRDDDIFLLWAFMYRIEPSIETLSVPVLFQRMIRGDFGNPGTVFRARRRIQAYDPDLRGHLTTRRRKDVINHYFNQYRAYFMGSFKGDLLFKNEEGGK